MQSYLVTTLDKNSEFTEVQYLSFPFSPFIGKIAKTSMNCTEAKRRFIRFGIAETKEDSANRSPSFLSAN